MRVIRYIKKENADIRERDPAIKVPRSDCISKF